jgi:hypothetical protein
MGSWDVARLLAASFESLGHRATVVVNQVERRAINILVSYERLSLRALPLLASRIRYIPYQLEQLSTGGAALTPAMLEILRHAGEIWDYSPQNLPALHQHGLHNVKILPLGYHEKLATIQDQPEDIDVLFYGLLNRRRLDILEPLSTRCALRCLEGVYGDQRDAFIARSKIILNIHYFPSRTAEQVRLSFLLNNARCVLSEDSPDNPLASLCATSPYEKLIDTCLALLADPDARTRLKQTARGEFPKHPMTHNLQSILTS